MAAEQAKTFAERIEDVGKTRDEQARAMIPAVKEAWAAYQLSMENTYRLVGEAKDVQVAEVTERLRDAAMKSRGAAEKLQEADPRGLRPADERNEKSPRPRRPSINRRPA